MKRKLILRILLISILFSLASANFAYAVTRDCDPPCSTYVVGSIISGFEGCWFEVFYKYYTCPYNNTIEVDSVVYYPSSNCGGFSGGQMFEQAVKQILYQSCLILNIRPPNNYGLTIKVPSCVREDTRYVQHPSYMDTLQVYHGCGTCCSSSFTVNVTNQQVNIIDRLPLIDSQDQCHEPGTPPECWDNCQSQRIDTGTVFTEPVPLCDGEETCSTSWTRDPGLPYFTGDTGGCTFDVYYEKRVCPYIPTDINEVRLYKIVLHNEDDCVGLSNCAIIRKALRVVFYHAFEIFNNQNSMTIRVRNPSCWKRYGKALVPCDYINDCCIWHYTLTKSGDDIYLEQPGQDAGNNNWCNDPCGTSLCDCFGIEATYLPKIGALEKEFELYEGKAFSLPNPSNSNIEIHYISTGRSLLSLKIYDDQGNYKFEIIKKQNSNEEVFQINSHNMLSGKYFYQIITDRNIGAEGSFIISK